MLHAASTGKGFFAFKLFINSFITLKTGSRRFREPQLPSFTPGVQLAITISISSDRRVSTVLHIAELCVARFLQPLAIDIIQRFMVIDGIW